ncbi:MAG: adaptor protein MecA [Oscillospiraceae bacterium]|nr:adaptor protein MecA [Oscillospiraceae bacterium]
MTVQRLSAGSVKVQLSADELNVLLPESARTPESPQMLRLISFMLEKAEAASGIPFSSLPVTVELLTAADGSLAAYFTAQMPAVPQKKHEPKIVRLAARFSADEPLRQCCILLYDEADALRNSMLYRYQQQFVLYLKVKREKSACIRHILAEHGSAYRMSVLNRARLSEYGRCLIEKDAVQKLIALRGVTL